MVLVNASLLAAHAWLSRLTYGAEQHCPARNGPHPGERKPRRTFCSRCGSGILARGLQVPAQRNLENDKVDFVLLRETAQGRKYLVAASPVQPARIWSRQHGRPQGQDVGFSAYPSCQEEAQGYYGDVTEKQSSQLRKQADEGDASPNDRLLERRLDMIVYRAKFAPTIWAARQIVSHGHVRVNGVKCNVASRRCDVGDEITLGPKAQEMALVLEAQGLAERDIPEYVAPDGPAKITFTRPARQFPIREDDPISSRILPALSLRAGGYEGPALLPFSFRGRACESTPRVMEAASQHKAFPIDISHSLPLPPAAARRRADSLSDRRQQCPPAILRPPSKRHPAAFPEGFKASPNAAGGRRRSHCSTAAAGRGLQPATGSWSRSSCRDDRPPTPLRLCGGTAPLPATCTDGCEQLSVPRDRRLPTATSSSSLCITRPSVTDDYAGVDGAARP